MKKQILFLTVSLLIFISCKEEEVWWDYTPDTFSFSEKEMEVEVSDETTSFKISVKKDDRVRPVHVTVDYSASSAVINKHYLLPKTDYDKYEFLFLAEKRSDTFEIKLLPKNIKEVVTIKFINNSDSGNANPERYFDTLLVKLIPVIKKIKQ